jgi:hypothetical protein
MKLSLHEDNRWGNFRFRSVAHFQRKILKCKSGERFEKFSLMAAFGNQNYNPWLYYATINLPRAVRS